METDEKYKKLIKKVAENVKRIRTAKKITQEQMIFHGFSYRHYQRIESGKHSFNLHTLYRLSQVFKVDLKKFLE